MKELVNWEVWWVEREGDLILERTAEYRTEGEALNKVTTLNMDKNITEIEVIKHEVVVSLCK